MAALYVSNLFDPEPPRWGLRGDPFLWREMAELFRHTPMPETAVELSAALTQAIELLTQHSLDASDNFFVERYSHGGMSSGHICPAFWREQALPLLLSRFTR
jgi:hypothetical protein